MALLVPLLLVLMFTMFDGAYFMWNQHKVVMGVRDAARYAGRLPFANFVSYNGTSYTCPITLPSTVETTIKNMARRGMPTDGAGRISGWINDDVQVQIACSTSVGGLYSSLGSNAPRVKVSTKFAYRPIVTQSLGLSTSIYMGAAAESPVMGL